MDYYDFQRIVRSVRAFFLRDIRRTIGMLLLCFGICYLLIESDFDSKSFSAEVIHAFKSYAPYAPLTVIIVGVILIFISYIKRNKQRSFYRELDSDYDKIPDFTSSQRNKPNDHKHFTSEIDFKIRIVNQELNFLRLRERLHSASYIEIEKLRYNDNTKYERSPFELYLSNRLKRITKNEQLFLIVTDYSEREGSLIIEFSLFVFTTLMSYGGFRDSIKSIKEDLDYFLKGVFPDDTKIYIDYDDKPNGIAFKTINAEFKKLKMIVMFIGILALGFSFYAVYKTESEPALPSNDNSKIQTIVRTEMDKAKAEKNIEELVPLMKEFLQQSKTDTSKIKNKQHG